jgi:hypothetical protein
VSGEGSRWAAGSALRGVLPSLLLNAAVPFVVYQLLRPAFRPGSVAPLVLAGVVPAAVTVVSLVRSRRVDVIAVFALLGVLAGILGVLVGGRPPWSLVGGALDNLLVGAAYLVSLLGRRPLVFVVARQFVAGGDAAHAARFDRLAGDPVFRRLTVLWAVGLLGVFALKVALAFAVSGYGVFLLVAPVLSYGVYLALVLVSLAQGKRVAARVAASRGAPADARGGTCAGP